MVHTGGRGVGFKRLTLTVYALHYSRDECAGFGWQALYHFFPNTSTNTSPLKYGSQTLRIQKLKTLIINP